MPYCNRGKQVAMDFADQLPSYYRFCPTDSELIVDCLNAKIESREPPKCRLHEVNIYNHMPEELAETYRSHENKWYFLTSRDRKYPRGNRPNRGVLGKHGYWKTTQIQKPVYDATSGEMVGYKGTLAFFDQNDDKTMWLMHEYTTNGPNNLSFENGDKLNEWVLCKIYKKVRTAKRDREADQEVRNPKEVMEEPNISLPKRRRVLENNEISFSNHQPQQVDVQETNIYSDTCVDQMVAAAHDQFDRRGQVNNGNTVGQIRMNSSPYPIPMQLITTFQGWSYLIQAPPPCYQNQFTSNASNGCQIYDHSASNYVSNIGPAASSSQPLDDGAYKTPISEHGLNSIQPVQIRESCYHKNRLSSTNACDDFLFSNGALNSSSMEPLDCNGYPLVFVQSSYEDAPTILDVQNVWDQSAQGNDAADDFHFPDHGYEVTKIFAPVEGELSSESLDSFIEQSMEVPQDDTDTTRILSYADNIYPDDKSRRYSCETTISAPVEVEWSSESMDSYIKQCMGVSQDDDAEDPKTQLNVQTGSNHYMVDSYVTKILL
ncbi:unnamed protein product [Lactuca virosa]|uniref:NAC domain-containing protein n=1 Tax=Lactuca virosa TaxID=75947 RepID=A0AAU9M4N9_9ASTR|nr:unnamed protein product [Lactuca virosa]